MKNHYTFRVDGFRIQPIASLSPPKEMGLGVWWINRINVPVLLQGKGHGNTLLRMVLDDADAEGVTLGLEISSSGPLSNERLEQWYADHGFQAVDLAIPGTKPRQVFPCWVRLPH